MANTYFQFKEFRVNQENCGMKVTTDACLFGAWSSEIAAKQKPKSILDIGSGTGVLSLMMAQKNSETPIIAVEIDELAAQQTRENFISSKWNHNLKVHHYPIQNFNPDKKFDFIITNPPFFNHHLLSQQNSRNKALHSTELSLSELLNSIDNLLQPAGTATILLPYNRVEEFKKLANSYSIIAETHVKQSEKHNYFRTMLCFCKQESNCIVTTEKEITIMQSGNYSTEFINYLKAFYLYL